MSSIKEQYEGLPYPHYVHPASDPAHLAAIAQILGLEAVDPAACRVLDIGCGAGTNLLAMAARMPHSYFLGLDFSAPDIASAQAVAAEAGLQNVEFRQADLMAWEPDGVAPFDYIIAYGFFSWVPDEVKDRLLRVIRRNLSPQGIGCVSYMTYPGCKQPEALRDLLRLRTETLANPVDKVSAAHITLDFLDRAWQALPGLPHAGYLREEVRRIRRKEPHFLLLDDLGVERDPCYMMQFVQWAAEHGLRYLGESEFHTMLLENLPATSAQELVSLGLDRLETEQLLDYVTNRTFRCTLLTGPDAALTQGMHAGALRKLCFAPRLKVSGKQKPRAVEGRFKSDIGTTITLRSTPLVAFVRALASYQGAFTPYPKMLAEAQRLTGKDFTPEEEARLCGDLLTLFGRRGLALSALPFTPLPQLLPRPRLTPLNAALSRTHGLVASATHESLRLNPEEQAICALLDGTRTLADLQGTPPGPTMVGKLEAHLETLRRQGCLQNDY